ncbi:C40 family peptidase [Clostridium sp. MSJ-11]|uniref:C40 family peptidase n=1 Tax=Clostridium mobile TaxID=2841512 RepID=A0ABS6EGD4_9CLOT|nr:C40 family peptidase [Clostridium mobile]MBU5484279.1 C40 family peptidase [Clostridium mobile]
MRRALKYFMMMFIVIAVSNKPVLAAPTSDQIQTQREQLEADKSNLKKAQEKRFEIEQKIENLDVQIEDTMHEIDKNKKQMDKVQENIKVTEEELKQTEEELKNEKEIFSKRMRAIYINGTDGYLEILFESNGFSDFISRVENIKSIIELDKKIMENIKLKEVQLNNKKEELNKQNDKLLALNNENSKKLDKLKISKNEQDELIKEVERQEGLYASVVDESQSKLNETLRQIQQIRNSTPKYTPSRGAAPMSGNNVVAYASNFLGTPYSWGGTTPAGFDCSGFTQYVYKHFGISLGRTTYDQIKNGYGVSREELQPGDLVFYGKGGNPTHMGIYVGNGMYIHSPRTGDVVKISSYDRSDYITARRVMR